MKEVKQQYFLNHANLHTQTSNIKIPYWVTIIHAQVPLSNKFLGQLRHKYWASSVLPKYNFCGKFDIFHVFSFCVLQRAKKVYRCQDEKSIK